jgi:hypothetical protein
MSSSNSWAEIAALFCSTRNALHERAKGELKALIPEDAKEATGPAKCVGEGRRQLGEIVESKQIAVIGRDY